MLKTDINHWNKRRIPEINLNLLGQIIFDKEAKLPNWKRMISLAKGVGKLNNHLYVHKDRLKSYIKINSK